jgi:hypothetical protein
MILGLDGPGAGDKLVAGLREGAIGGCVLTLRYRRPKNLRAAALELADDYEGSTRMVDPCSHYITYQARGLGHYADYPFTFSGLDRRGLRDLKLEDYATQCLDYQNQLRVSALVAPGVPLETFDDFRSELALQAFDAAYGVQQASNSLRELPLLHSLSFRESALSSFQSTSDYLDLLTQVRGDGFYLTVSRDVKTDSQWGNPDRAGCLSNLLYLVYTLSLNGYRVVYSYSDMVGLLTLAAGGSEIAAGWFSTTRQLYCGDIGRSSTGGGQPRALYASRPLLSWLLLSSDVATLIAAEMTDDIVDSVGYDQRIRNGGPGTEWRRRTETLHFWHVMSALAAEIKGPPTVEERVGVLESLIARAIATDSAIQGRRVRIEKRPSHLSTWAQALQSFRVAIAEGE